MNKFCENYAALSVFCAVVDSNLKTRVPDEVVLVCCFWLAGWPLPSGNIPRVPDAEFRYWEGVYRSSDTDCTKHPESPTTR